jgi:hypothetical protein
VAVGDERTHPELLGKRERITVVAVSVLRGIAPGGDLGEEAEGGVRSERFGSSRAHWGLSSVRREADHLDQTRIAARLLSHLDITQRRHWESRISDRFLASRPRTL